MIFKEDMMYLRRCHAWFRFYEERFEQRRDSGSLVERLKNRKAGIG